MLKKIFGLLLLASTVSAQSYDTAGNLNTDTRRWGNVSMTAAATLADNFSNPTAPPMACFQMGWDGATWDRIPGTSADGMLVNLGANNDVTAIGTVAHDAAAAAVNPLLMGGYASAAAPSDVSADNDAVRAWHLRNG